MATADAAAASRLVEQTDGANISSVSTLTARWHKSIRGSVLEASHGVLGES